MPGDDAGSPPINSTILSLALIFIPGILCYGIVSILADKKTRTNPTIVLQMLMYGVSSYLIAALLNIRFPSSFPKINIPILDPSKLDHTSIDPIGVGYASLVGVIQGVLITINVNYDLMMRLCQKIKLTKRSGDPDIWSYLLNSGDIDNWVTIRNQEKSLIYQGYVQGFSTGQEKRQLLLVDVLVFDLDTAEEVGSISVLYISFVEDKDIILELRSKQSDK